MAAEASAPGAPPASILGPSHAYDLGQRLGVGGFAAVYRGTHRATLEEVAVKVISKETIARHRLRARVRHEIEIQRGLQHENVVGLRDYFEDAEHVYLVLELCNMGNLYSWYKRQPRPARLRSLRPLLRQLLRGLRYLHRQRVVHRDLKLSNLLLHRWTAADGQRHTVLKIADFGFAARLSSEDQEQFTWCGTPNYIPPEMARHGAHGLPADLWSLGCVAYTLLMGKPPYEVGGGDELKENLRTAQLSDVCWEGVRPEERSFLEALLQQDPQRRVTVESIWEHPFIQGPRRRNAVEAGSTKFGGEARSPRRSPTRSPAPSQSRSQTRSQSSSHSGRHPRDHPQRLDRSRERSLDRCLDRSLDPSQDLDQSLERGLDRSQSRDSPRGQGAPASSPEEATQEAERLYAPSMVALDLSRPTSVLSPSQAPRPPQNRRRQAAAVSPKVLAKTPHRDEDHPATLDVEVPRILDPFAGCPRSATESPTTLSSSSYAGQYSVHQHSVPQHSLPQPPSLPRDFRDSVAGRNRSSMNEALETLRIREVQPPAFTSSDTSEPSQTGSLQRRPLPLSVPPAPRTRPPGRIGRDVSHEELPVTPPLAPPQAKAKAPSRRRAEAVSSAPTHLPPPPRVSRLSNATDPLHPAPSFLPRPPPPPPTAQRPTPASPASAEDASAFYRTPEESPPALPRSKGGVPALEFGHLGPSDDRLRPPPHSSTAGGWSFAPDPDPFLRLTSPAKDASMSPAPQESPRRPPPRQRRNRRVHQGLRVTQALEKSEAILEAKVEELRRGQAVSSLNLDLDGLKPLAQVMEKDVYVLRKRLLIHVRRRGAAVQWLVYKSKGERVRVGQVTEEDMPGVTPWWRCVLHDDASFQTDLLRGARGRTAKEPLASLSPATAAWMGHLRKLVTKLRRNTPRVVVQLQWPQSGRSLAPTRWGPAQLVWHAEAIGVGALMADGELPRFQMLFLDDAELRISLRNSKVKVRGVPFAEVGLGEPRGDFAALSLRRVTEAQWKVLLGYLPLALSVLKQTLGVLRAGEADDGVVEVRKRLSSEAVLPRGLLPRSAGDASPTSSREIEEMAQERGEWSLAESEASRAALAIANEEPATPSDGIASEGRDAATERETDEAVKQPSEAAMAPEKDAEDTGLEAYLFGGPEDTPTDEGAASDLDV